MLNPSILSVAQGGSNGVTVTTSLVGMSAPQNLVLSATGLPSNITAIFNPTTIQSGQSATVTFTATTGASPGTSTVTITATGPLTTHSNTLALTVVASDFNI